MNPNAGEPGDHGGTQGGVAVEPPVNNVSPDLGSLQDVVNAAKDAAGVQAASTPAPTAPTPEQAAFMGQFDPKQSTMPATESGPATANPTSPDLMNTALGVLGSAAPATQEGSASVSDVNAPATENLATTEQAQSAEAPAQLGSEPPPAAQPEETPKDPKQEARKSLNKAKTAWDELTAALNKVLD